VDFARRHLTLMQPSARMRNQGFDAGFLTRLKDELFRRHVEILDLDCNYGDQLTRELEHFVNCVRTGATPRVSGLEGRDAIELAMRVLESIDSHSWEGAAEGPTGPLHLPRPRGQLFTPSQDEAAA
jgi:predicted dehydrogenase